MEIGHQGIDHMERSAREDKDIGVATERLEHAIARGTFQRTHAGGADGNYSTTARTARRDCIDHVLADFQPLGVHVVIFKLLDAHRLERPRAHVQRDESGLNALGRNRFHQRLIEMQPRRRRRHRTEFLGVHGLITLAIRAFVRAVYIRRQRHVPDAIKQRQHFFSEAQLEQRIVTRKHFCLATTVDKNLRTRLRRLAGTHMGQHAMRIEHPLNEDFQLAARGFLPEQPRRNHPGIVEHHQIARAQMLKQISELTVCQGAADPIQGQQATIAPLGQRMAGDQRIRELEGKVSNAHDGVRLAGPGSLAEISKILHVPD
ncbi:hypothetical protein D3C86_558240 [compost metagenome]